MKLDPSGYRYGQRLSNGQGHKRVRPYAGVSTVSSRTRAFLATVSSRDYGSFTAVSFERGGKKTAGKFKGLFSVNAAVS
jgi:hypothetical protein